MSCHFLIMQWNKQGVSSDNWIQWQYWRWHTTDLGLSSSTLLIVMSAPRSRALLFTVHIVNPLASPSRVSAGSGPMRVTTFMSRVSLSLSLSRDRCIRSRVRIRSSCFPPVLPLRQSMIGHKRVYRYLFCLRQSPRTFKKYKLVSFSSLVASP